MNQWRTESPTPITYHAFSEQGRHCGCHKCIKKQKKQTSTKHPLTFGAFSELRPGKKSELFAHVELQIVFRPGGDLALQQGDCLVVLKNNITCYRGGRGSELFGSVEQYHHVIEGTRSSELFGCVGQ